MPSKRTRTPRNRRLSELSEIAERFITECSTPEDKETWEYYMLRFNRRCVTSKLWGIYGAEITDAWIKTRPGTRPRCWWRYSAPRHPTLPENPQFPKVEARRPWFGLVDNQAAHEFGLPYFRHPDTDFESEAAYLARHGLLEASEK
jgi:hypothetical protein